MGFTKCYCTCAESLYREKAVKDEILHKRVLKRIFNFIWFLK